MRRLRSWMKQHPDISAIVAYALLKLLVLGCVAGREICRAVSFLPESLFTPARMTHTANEMTTAFNRLASGFAVPFSITKQLITRFYALESLPTIQEGMRSLEMTSLLEWFWKRRSIPRMKSRFVAPDQKPYIFFPGLTAQRFYDSTSFLWQSTLTLAYPVIKAELEDLLRERQRLAPYRNELGLHRTPFVRECRKGATTYDKGDWNVFYFYQGGKRVEANCQRCPRTAETLEAIEGLEKYMACFSLLGPHSRIPPHYGPFNGVLRVHLPLIVPEGCGLAVGHQETTWEEGKPLVFDDSFLHEVWNPTNQWRAVLFLNIFHPDWRPDERRIIGKFVDSLFEELPIFRQWTEGHEKPTQEAAVTVAANTLS